MIRLLQGDRETIEYACAAYGFLFTRKEQITGFTGGELADRIEAVYGTSSARNRRIIGVLRLVQNQQVSQGG